MKIDRHGKAKVLTPEEIGRLFTSGLTTVRDRTLGAVMLYTACRVSECVTLKIQDVYDSRNKVRPELNIRKGSTKGKLSTRTIPVLDELRHHLELYKPKVSRDSYLFPGRWGRGHLHEDYAALIFRRGCKLVDIEGASTHSCRRTALTLMSNARIPLRVIQQISGHRSLEQLQEYLDVEASQVRGAIAALSMLTPPSVSSNKNDLVDENHTELFTEF
ncbi:integrase [Nostoc sp. 'Peltigera membranacea cyanobiont' 213]|uniref:tyrosine-type recombinase/integrase n=1 Tax=Nostoc cyanobionts TaxID=3123326 RepID=UPI000B952F3A|nr:MULTISPECIES: site-specific integrase [unclassified Nostoc]OYD91328.1 integrase [Nostoc sp. 'Peltigera membranacea cyanobiont' 213]OYE04010.1 integrase [Nostoc sp. 'Peltigera membranacea cyanobiont' 232]